ncbi:Toprim domain-containing protein [Rhizobium sp. PP-F2F-G36]|nr:Toprim domain-containing protein [Rhizobium sp. PP-F2F-G36]
MEKRDIEDLRGRVACAAVLEKVGFAIDVKESTRRAVKHRRGAEIVIVIHEGRGWFDPLSDAKGDLFSLVMHLDRVDFAEAVTRIADLVGFVASEPAWKRRSRTSDPEAGVPDRWTTRRKPWPGSATWCYLSGSRFLPDAIIRAALAQDVLREGPKGSMWAAHTDEGGTVTGWEERGPDWRGFASGGAKTLFRLGSPDAERFCVTEAAIDAMSLAAIEGMREGTLYLSTGGGWSPATDEAIRALVARPGAQLVAATDANSQGEAFATRCQDIAEAADCGWLRLRPLGEDWNAVLMTKGIEERERRVEGQRRRGGETRLPHARRPRQG